MLNEFQQDNRLSVINDLEEQKNTMFPQFFGRWEHGNGETHFGDVWRPPPNFREIQGDWISAITFHPV